MSRLPIRARVTVAFGGAMAVLLAGLGTFVYLRFEAHLNATIDQGLRSRADEVAALADERDSGLRDSNPGALSESDDSFAQLLSPSGRLLDTTPQLGDRSALPAEALVAARSAPVLVDVASEPAADAGPARLLASPTVARGRSLIVVVGAALDDRDDALHNLAAVILIGGPVALALATLLGYGAAGLALRPVEAMRRRAAAISADQLDERLPLPAADDELRRLGETLNRMLDRLETAIERERTFVDDASHELRTPLALHKTELELALRYADEPAALRAAIASAIEEVDRLIGLAEDLLVVARSEKGRLAIESQRIDVRGLFADLRERFSSRARESGRELLVGDVEIEVLEADRLRLEQALTNLIDNALRYGEGEVVLSARAVDSSVRLGVRDRGPGFPEGLADRAFERFTRADVARVSGGTGLGLAIVGTIASAHRGSVGARNLQPTGADVWIELPNGS